MLKPKLRLGLYFPVVVMMSGYIFSRIKIPVLIFIVCSLLALGNLTKSTKLLGEDESSILTNQLRVVDYTYKESAGENFAINSVTNPLYINYIWAYNYPWYGLKRYGYLPTWAGGDQLYPYDTLSKLVGNEKYLYLLIDETPRIPQVHKLLAIKWANERSVLEEEKSFGGILVQKRIFSNKN